MFRRSAGILLDIALISLVAVVVVTAAVGPVAALSGRLAFVIGGGSMAPALAMGSIALVDPSGAPVKAGEIVTFRTPQSIVVTHRVVRVVVRADGTWYETKGDSNEFPDPALWPASAVVGPVVASVPGIGFMSWLFRHPIGWLNVALLAGWLLVARRIVQAPEVSLDALSSRPDHRPLVPEGADAGSLVRGT